MAVSRKFIGVAGALLACVPFTSWAAGPEPEKSLYLQSASTMLTREFSDPRISYALADSSTGKIELSRWDDAQRPIPVGSLVKPFTAIAYRKSHLQDPNFVCHGTEDGCWRPKGHGRLSMAEAIAQSCNAFFRYVAAQVGRAELDRTLHDFGAGSLDGHTSTATYVGLTDGWRMSVDELAKAYSRLLAAHNENAEFVVSGMRSAARNGTAEAIAKRTSLSVLAKTGTAVCSHSRRAAGDGFVVAVFPADSPRQILIVRVHGTTGARAADIAGKMIARLQEPGIAK